MEDYHRPLQSSIAQYAPWPWLVTPKPCLQVSFEQDFGIIGYCCIYKISLEILFLNWIDPGAIPQCAVPVLASAGRRHEVHAMCRCVETLRKH